MDAVTSFELEALRRRETIAGDRDLALAQVEAWTEAVTRRIVEPRLPRRRLARQTDCEPAPLARQAAG